jgi:hypothetical protein
VQRWRRHRGLTAIGAVALALLGTAWSSLPMLGLPPC